MDFEIKEECPYEDSFPNIDKIDLDKIKNERVTTAGFETEPYIKSEPSDIGEEENNVLFEPQLLEIGDVTIKIELIEHSTPETLYQCSTRDKRLPEKSYPFHIPKYNREKRFECNVCKKKFSNSSALRNHNRVHTGEKLHKCKVCNEAFRLAGSLNRHMLIHCKNQEGHFECELCAQIFEVHYLYIEHMQTHIGEETLKCEVCQKRILIRLESMHLKLHAENGSIFFLQSDTPVKCRPQSP